MPSKRSRPVGCKVGRGRCTARPAGLAKRPVKTKATPVKTQDTGLAKGRGSQAALLQGVLRQVALL